MNEKSAKGTGWAARHLRGARSILVVDDDLEMRRAVSAFLASAYFAYDVIEAEDGEAALEQLRDDVALVIADVNMPRLDGFELTRRLRTDPALERYRALPIILLTARDTEDDLEQSWDAGSTLHVPKPFEIDRLHRAMRSVLEP